MDSTFLTNHDETFKVEQFLTPEAMHKCEEQVMDFLNRRSNGNSSKAYNVDVEK